MFCLIWSSDVRHKRSNTIHMCTAVQADLSTCLSCHHDMTTLTSSHYIHTTQHADLYVRIHDESGHHLGRSAITSVGTADVVSCLWLKLTDVVLGYPEVYICVCYIPQKKDFIQLRNSHRLSSAIMNACRMMHWSTKARVPRLWSVATSTLALQRSQLF